MADRIFEPLRSFIKEGILIAGSFRPNGTGAVDNALNTGLGFTVARTGVGVFLVTFDDRFASVIRKFTELALDVVAARGTMVTALDLSAKTMEITILNTSTGAAADVASDPLNVVSFEVFFKNSTVFP
jgi:hypothetical protein